MFITVFISMSYHRVPERGEKVSVLISLLTKTLILLAEGPIFMTLISLNSLLQILARTSWLSSATSYCKALHTLFHLYTWIIPPRSSHLGLNVTSSKTCSLSTHHHGTSCLYAMALTAHCGQSSVR